MVSTRTLGPWQVYPIGLGCMNVSWPGRAATDPETRVSSAIAGIHAGLNAGVTLLDTADIYAPSWDTVGHNELFVAEALATWDAPPTVRRRPFWLPQKVALPDRRVKSGAETVRWIIFSTPRSHRGNA